MHYIEAVLSLSNLYRDPREKTDWLDFSPTKLYTDAYKNIEPFRSYAMKMQRKARKLRSFAMCLSLLAYLYMILIGSDQFVLCFGSDGHVALEPARNGLDCSYSPAHSEPLSCSVQSIPPEQEFSLRADHCGPCFDILLSSLFQHFIPAQYHWAGHINFAFQTASYLSSPFSHMTHGNFPSTSSPIIREILIFLRTVILLT